MVVVAGSEGLNQAIKDLLFKIHSNLFEVMGVEVEDLHDAEKLKNVLLKIKKEKGKDKLYAVGLEYGANLLVNAAVLDDSLITGLACLGNPLDLETAEKNIENSWTARLFYYDLMLSGRVKNNKKVTAATKLYDVDRLAYDLSSEAE